MLFMSKSQHGIQKIEVTYVPFNSVGVVSSSDVISSIRPVKNVMVPLMLDNNESVALLHIRKVGVRCREFQVMFHTKGW